MKVAVQNLGNPQSLPKYKRRRISFILNRDQMQVGKIWISFWVSQSICRKKEIDVPWHASYSFAWLNFFFWELRPKTHYRRSLLGERGQNETMISVVAACLPQKTILEMGPLTHFFGPIIRIVQSPNFLRTKKIRSLPPTFGWIW